MAPFVLTHGGAELLVAPLGGMVEARLRLPDGRIIAPLFRPAWADAPDAPADPPLLRDLRGEWLCVPFGYPRARDELAPQWRAETEVPDEGAVWPHGYSANHPWRLTERSSNRLSTAIDYPPGAPVERLERQLALGDDGASFSVESVIHIRRACALPVALHCTFAVPATVGALRLCPGRFARGYTHPTVVEAGRSVTAVGARFDDLASVPAAGGGRIALNRLPLAVPAEEVLLLAGADGSFALHDEAAGVVTTLRWDAERLPHCQIWISNGGRLAAPWSGRNHCVGVEPCCAAMDLGTTVSTRANPLTADGFATAVALSPGEPWRCSYTLAVAPL
jgi:hypothetical protein